MRRSQAPSMRRAAKRGASVLQGEDSVTKYPTSSPPMQWGTSGNTSSKLGPRQIEADENPLKNSRIFHVLWRNPSTRKHKIWTGNGTLVVTGSKATLKDETGKVLGTLTCCRPEQIREYEQLEIELKEVEIQEELTTVDECIAIRNQEIANWCRKIDEENGHIVSPLIDVSRPQRPIMLKRKDISNPSGTYSPPTFSKIEYICVLNPAQLQIQTLQILEKDELSPGLVNIQRIICDHPVLLRNQLDNEPNIREILLPHLPSWQEMGLYDSPKFEFVHLMLDDLVVARGKKCVIVAQSQDCLELIKGYCQSWDIAYIQIDQNHQANRFNADVDTMVGLLRVNRLSELEPFSLHSNNLILYNFEARDEVEQLLAMKANTLIYTLVTADCVEGNGLAINFDTNWKHLKSPFNEDFLKAAFLNDKVEILKAVYTKETQIVGRL